MSNSNIKEAAKLLRSGGVCAIGTETVYGLAADFENTAAIRKIFELKKRPLHNPLIVHCQTTWSDLGTLTTNGIVSDQTGDMWRQVYEKVVKRFPSGPLTLLMPKGPKISDLVTAGSPYVAIRRPYQCAMEQVLKILEMPLVAPSANIYQQLSPTSAQMVDAQFVNRKFPIIDSGDCKEGIESTVVSIQNDTLTIHRLGPITVNQLKECDIKVRQQVLSHASSPGQDKKHYSPHTPIRLVANLNEAQLNLEPGKTGLLLFQEQTYKLPNALNLGTDAKQAAHMLYRSLFELDQMGLKEIIVVIPQEPCFHAIRDKLNRAASI
ncbi:MAG: L-threonylcarbamoyladenylate synthase [Oligoflexales bacterium]